ncbi:MAG: pirin family protein [Microthrixaceae bacterium]
MNDAADDSGSTSRGGVPRRPAGVELSDAREADVGGVPVRRVLPQRTRRTVGAWCFVDHAGGPGLAASMDVGPHPHIGLQTVTWLLEGEVLHRDSLGSEQVIRPGQLNLMTAGGGVVHSEEQLHTHLATSRALHAVQLWVALPEETRHGPAAFEHHAELPQVALPGGEATVLVGAFAGTTSPARTDTEHFGVDMRSTGGPISVPLSTRHEHAVAVVQGAAETGGTTITPGHLAYIGTGSDELHLDAEEGSRFILLGGVPFPERPFMWWNYVARSAEEVSAAHRDWTQRADRFGSVASDLEPIDVPAPPWES